MFGLELADSDPSVWLREVTGQEVYGHGSSDAVEIEDRRIGHVTAGTLRCGPKGHGLWVLECGAFVDRLTGVNQTAQFPSALASSARRASVSATSMARTACEVRITPWKRAATRPGMSLGTHSPTTARHPSSVDGLAEVAHPLGDAPVVPEKIPPIEIASPTWSDGGHRLTYKRLVPFDPIVNQRI